MIGQDMPVITATTSGLRRHRQSGKQIVRHFLFRCGLSKVLDARRSRRGLKTAHLRERNLKNIFSQIYSTGAWRMSEDQISLSGSGSTDSATRNLIPAFEAFLAEIGCRKLVDIGCGDFNWMRNVEGDFDYLGMDIVPELIEANDAAFGTAKRRFACIDAVTDKIESGDVAVCREVLFHLSFRNGLQLLRNIRAAGFSYIVITNDDGIWFNSDIRNGDFRPLNLTKAPFRLPPPERKLTDDKVMPGRALGIWRHEQLPQ